MSGIMRRSLVFMLMLILMSTSNVHAEEWETFVKVQTEEHVTERFNADYGAADFWEELVDANSVLSSFSS